MKLEGDYLFDATVPEVWSALFDPVILAAVMPGCEKLELVDGQYVGEIKVKVGPVQGKFTGKVDLKDKVEPVSYTMVVDGRGAPGFVKATAMVKLAAEGTGTRVTYDADAQVGGKIASVGQRLLEASSRAIVAQSLEGLHTNIKLRTAAYRDAAAKQAAAGLSANVPAAGIEPGAQATPPAAAAAAGAVPAASDATDAITGEATSTAEPAKPGGANAGPAPSAAAATAGAARPAAAPAPDDAAKPRAAPSDAAAPAGPADIAFTPVKVKQSALANAVAKEVASSLFPRSVLVAIIVIQAIAIVFLLVR